jgi:4-hydroxy-3-methylbut-2-en-1-yl diphosphate synthase IspG/GcpE
MAQSYTSCPRCAAMHADLWRVKRQRGEDIKHLICRHCAFDWTITEPGDVSVSRELSNYALSSDAMGAAVSGSSGKF